MALLANDACGSPVPVQMCLPWTFFDGKLFHSKLIKATQARNLIGKKIFRPNDRKNSALGTENFPTRDRNFPLQGLFINAPLNDNCPKSQLNVWLF